MKREHPTDDALARWVADAADPANPEGIGEHVASCERCEEEVVAVRLFNEALEDRETWEAVELAESGAPPRGLTEAISQLKVEDAAADYVLADSLRDPEAFAQSAIHNDNRYHTAGVVRRLVQASIATRESQPRFALALANAAVTIAEQLHEDRYSTATLSSVRGGAWRERANALRYTGDYPAALAAVDRAAESFRRGPAPEFDLARLDFIKGTVLVKMQRFVEGLPLARRSRACFLTYGDIERGVHAGLLEGAVLFELNQHEEAKSVFESLLRPARETDSGSTIAFVHNSLGLIYVELRQFKEAAEHFAQALSLYDHHGMVIERVRTEWSLAHLAIRQGRDAEGVSRLRAVIRDFDLRGMTSEAALVALDLAEQLFKNGSHKEVVALSDELGDRFVHAGMASTAGAAMRFLRSAAMDQKGADDAVRHLRTYFNRLAEEPTLLFLRPEPHD